MYSTNVVWENLRDFPNNLNLFEKMRQKGQSLVIKWRFVVGEKVHTVAFCRWWKVYKEKFLKTDTVIYKQS